MTLRTPLAQTRHLDHSPPEPRGHHAPFAYGRMLKRLRISAGLTQEALSERTARLGRIRRDGSFVSRTQLSNLERGYTTKALRRTHEILIAALGKDMSDPDRIEFNRAYAALSRPYRSSTRPAMIAARKATNQ